ncbi:MAG: hypothetical protein AABZ67_06975, partial [Pseudomonadota bacterium]
MKRWPANQRLITPPAPNHEISVSTVGQQELDDFLVSGSHREVEWRVAGQLCFRDGTFLGKITALNSGMGIRPARNQDFNYGQF